MKKCLECQKLHKNKSFCSVNCHNKWQKKNKCGENHPLFGKKLSQATKDKIRNAHLGKKLEDEHRKKVTKNLIFGESAKGSNNPFWKGDKITYKSLHTWLNRKYGKANKCESINCNGKSKKYVYAKKHGRKYTRNINDYMQLCHSCHMTYDCQYNNWNKKRYDKLKYVGNQKKANLS